MTQPTMAKFQEDDDVLKRSGDFLETSALPPRANVSVYQPALAQTSNLVSKADSTDQTGTCLSQSAHKLTIPLSTITKLPMASHDEPSLAADEILTALPITPSHTIPKYTHLHHTVPTHTSLHISEISTALPHTLTPNCGNAGPTSTQTIPTTGLGLAAVAPATTTQLHSTSDSLTGRKSTAETQITNISAPHTQSPAQTTVGEDKWHTPPPAVAPATGTSGVMTSQPVVIVKQFQTPKPYSGQSSHKSFKEHFERVAKANGWTTEQERMQHLALALEGPAVECFPERNQERIVSCGPSSLIALVI